MTGIRNVRNAEVKAATRGLINEHTRTNSINFISSNNINLIMDIGENGMNIESRCSHYDWVTVTVTEGNARIIGVINHNEMQDLRDELQQVIFDLDSQLESNKA